MKLPRLPVIILIIMSIAFFTIRIWNDELIFRLIAWGLLITAGVLNYIYHKKQIKQGSSSIQLEK